jgi:hypothetical protein
MPGINIAKMAYGGLKGNIKVNALPQLNPIKLLVFLSWLDSMVR